VKIEVEIPQKEQVLQSGLVVRVARRGESWSEKQLGRYAKEQGVYVICHDDSIKYVGKTDGPTMSFGMRLRREFQETASQRRHIYPRLAGLPVPPHIRVCFLDFTKLRALVQAHGIALDDVGRTAILEQALMHAYDPDFQSPAK